EKKATASMAYWSNAQPIAIREASAGPTGETGFVHTYYAGGVTLVMKNTGKDSVVIKAVDISGSVYSSIWTINNLHDRLKVAAAQQCGGPQEDCAANIHSQHKCNFVLGPSDEFTMILNPQPGYGDQCSSYPDSYPSLNSVRKSISMPVSIWYEQNGIMKLEKGAVSLYIPCQEYWSCVGGTPDDCDAKYSCLSTCIAGACTSGSCTGCH
ncbi:MAG: hypothetical protein NTV88_02865, partial [Candidatus Micrarchaeota archaeon]|nr:hypothetical protein [Candidatus Micrarchaeota archaeon]